MHFEESLSVATLCRCDSSHAPLKVAVLLSGGVDSSCALHLLKEAGHHVTAFYLQIWFQEDFRNYWDQCPWEDDLDYCQKVHHACSLLQAQCVRANSVLCTDMRAVISTTVHGMLWIMFLIQIDPREAHAHTINPQRINMSLHAAWCT